MRSARKTPAPWALIALVAAITLTSCATGSDTEATHTPEAQTDTEHEAIDFHSGEPKAPETPTVWDDEAEASAKNAAEDTMTAFLAHTGVDRDTWWASLAPHLDVAAQRDYAWLDHTQIPATRLTGPITIREGAAPSLAEATIPTDAGDYSVTLSRRDGASAWEAGRIYLIEPGQ